MNEDEQFFQDLNQNIKNLDSHLESINSNLEHYQIEPISYGKGKNSLEQQFKKTPEGVGAFGPITNFIHESIRIKESIKNYVNNYSLIWNIEQQKAKDIRKSERRDMWILWFQKLVRWSLGAITAVLLYSFVVWASEYLSFIKIPIKDWFPR